MRRFMVSILTLLMLVSGIGCGKKPVQNCPGDIRPPEEALSLVSNGDVEYWIKDVGICQKDTNTLQESLLVKSENLSHLQILDGMLYYVQTSDTGDDFTLYRLSENGGTPETVFTRQTLCGDKGIQLQEWQLHNGLFYVWGNMTLYIYDPAVGQGKLLKDDVATFALEGNTLYHIDHAARTFTIYRTDLTTGQQEILLGDGTYEEKTADETLYKHFCLLNGVLYYTTKSPSGLYRYENGQSTLISDSDTIDEFSLCADNGSIYYVERADGEATLKAYCPVTNTTYEAASVSDYHRTETVKNACFFYYSYNTDTGKQTLHNFVMETIATVE